MNKRIKILREKLNLNQEDFGTQIGISKSAVSGYEIGRRNLSDQTIRAIVREFNVSEKWLRTGSGDVFNLTQDDELLDLQKKYNLDQLDIKILQEYLKLSPEHRKVFKGYFVNVFGGAIADEDEAIDLEVEAYRKELEDERRFSTSGATPDSADVKKKVG
ncbi:MAG: helix-turn-helix transcriptional regulator [Acetobacterium woodii]|nr:helix-turn-helix transcriptional regulator [Acetobacterium woodii]